MLIITFHNQGQINNVANYVYVVYVNQEPIATGTLTGHNRALGWEGLVQQLAENLLRGVTPDNP